MRLFGPPGAGDRVARRLIIPLATVLGLLLLVFGIFFAPLQVTGDSMLPGLAEQDRVLVTRGYSAPTLGDVVHIDAHELPRARGEQVIKRVVALAGDTVRVEGGRAVVNGAPEATEAPLIVSDSDVSTAEITVPDGYVYVLGDNRPVSLDSRFYGPVPLDLVKGRVVFLFTPVTRLGTID